MHPLVRIYEISMLFMGKSTISTGPLSLAMLNYGRAKSMERTVLDEVVKNDPLAVPFAVLKATSHNTECKVVSEKTVSSPGNRSL